MAWARAVKARRRGVGLPPLWLFSDAARVPDLWGAINRLPPGAAGVVLRDGLPAATVRQLVRLCRQRRIAVSVAGGVQAGPAAGRHLRRGYFHAGSEAAFLTSSAHSPAEVRRAWRAGAALIFLSPVFATESHPGAAAMGVVRWSALASVGRSRLCALGGIDGVSVRRLPRWVRGAGAIGALAE